MTLDSALQRLWVEVARSSARRVAAQIGVSPATLTRWKAGRVPEGESRERLLAWAESLPSAGAVDAGLLGRTVDSVHSSVQETVTGQSVLDPVQELVKRGQAEQAAWVLEFAAQLLEAGAKRLRQGLLDHSIAKEDAVVSAVALTQSAPVDARRGRAKAVASG